MMRVLKTLAVIAVWLPVAVLVCLVPDAFMAGVVAGGAATMATLGITGWGT